MEIDRVYILPSLLDAAQQWAKHLGFGVSFNRIPRKSDDGKLFTPCIYEAIFENPRDEIRYGEDLLDFLGLDLDDKLLSIPVTPPSVPELGTVYWNIQDMKAYVFIGTS